MTSSTTVVQLTVPRLGAVAVTVARSGAGRPVLLLHGGGGPRTVTPWAERWAAAGPASVLTPTHPGFAGTPRPAGLDSITGLAAVYAGLLDTLDLHDVTVVGNSIGGWITAELALLDPARIGAVVLIDAVGIEVAGHPVADFFALTPAELARRAYADPGTYGIDPETLSPAERAAMAGNRAALGTYAGRAMTDPTLAARLAAVRIPTLVVWGGADRIVDPAYGRAYAAAVPSATFTLLPAAGHLPQLEAPDDLVAAVRAFTAAR